MTPDARTQLRETLTGKGWTETPTDIWRIYTPRNAGEYILDHAGTRSYYLKHIDDIGVDLTDPTVRSAITAVWAAIDEPGGQGR